MKGENTRMAEKNVVEKPDTSKDLLVAPLREDLAESNAVGGNLDHGLLGPEMSPGFRKIIVGDPSNHGTMNFVIHGGGDGIHQHWQKFCNPERTQGYWQNVTGQVAQHRKAYPISKLIGKKEEK